MKTKFTSVSLVVLLASAFTAFGDAPPLVTSFNGTTAGQPTWNRPIGGKPPTSLSGLGTAVPFFAQPFFADQAGSYSFLSSTSPSNWDNYSFLYAGTFNPLSQFTNILIGNDDAPSFVLSGFSYNLTAKSPYVLVITGFENKDSGSFRNTITGPGKIEFGRIAKVPEAGSIQPILGFVLAGLGICHWKQKRTKPLSA